MTISVICSEGATVFCFLSAAASFAIFDLDNEGSVLGPVGPVVPSVANSGARSWFPSLSFCDVKPSISSKSSRLYTAECSIEHFITDTAIAVFPDVLQIDALLMSYVPSAGDD